MHATRVSVNSGVSERPPPIIFPRMRDGRGRRGAVDRHSMPANHRERCVPIVRGAITRVDVKKGVEGRKSCHVSRPSVKQMTPLNLAHSACSLLRAHSSRDTSSRGVRSYATPLSFSGRPNACLCACNTREKMTALVKTSLVYDFVYTEYIVSSRI